MGYYDFPHTRNYDTDLGYLIKRYFELNKEFDSVKSEFNSLKKWCLSQLNSEALKTLVANKLDEWLQDGTLEALINNPLNHVTTYDTVVEMLTHSGLLEGSKIYCAGADTVNDGKGGHFRIRARLSSDDIDSYNLYLIDGGIKVAERITDISINYVTPEMFGAVGDGETDDTAAIQSALDYLKTLVSYTGTTEVPQSMTTTGAQKQSVTLYFSDKKYKFNTVYADCYGLSLCGNGVLDGTIEIGEDDTIKWVDIKITNLRFIHSSRKNSIVLKNVRRGQISNCTFIGADSGIYIKHTSLEYNQQVNQWIIDSNSFIDSNYAINTDNYTSYLIGDFIISSNEIDINNIGICIHGCDGLTINGNKMFCLKANKGILLDSMVNFVEISGNSIFESKYNAIDISSFQNVIISGNNLPYAGEESISSAIYLHGYDTSGAQYYNVSTVIGNNILQPSSCGIEVIDSGYINIFGNNIIACGQNPRYRGSEAQSPYTVKAIKSTRRNSTNLIMCNNTGENRYSDSTFGSYTLDGQNGFNLSDTTLEEASITDNTLKVSDGIGYYGIAANSTVNINKINGGVCGQTLLIFSYNNNVTITCDNSNIYGTTKQIPSWGYALLTKVTNEKWVLLN